jgi:hypothetical protein
MIIRPDLKHKQDIHDLITYSDATDPLVATDTAKERREFYQISPDFPINPQPNDIHPKEHR